MRWLLMLLMSAMLIWTTSGCVFSDDADTPDTTVVDTDDDVPSSSTTIIDDVDPPAADTDVDLNVDADGY